MLALTLGASPAPDAPICAASAPHASILLEVGGFKAQTGIVNIWVYGGNPSDFLARDKRLLRLKYPVPRVGTLRACIVVPGPGRYAIAAHHDVDSDRQRDLTDGVAFSNNPHLTIIRLKPRFDQASFDVGATGKVVYLNVMYRSGLAIRPINARRR